jgi:hypothetical protein
MPRRREAKPGQVDLAFMRSREFSALLTNTEPLLAAGSAPYTVTNEQREVIFETNELTEMRRFLLRHGSKGLEVQRYKGPG